MNTPTPAQALGDCLSVIAPMIGKKQFTVTKYDDGTSALEGDNNYMAAVCMCLDLVIKHGQHFAGLEAEAAELRAWKAEEAAFLMKAASMLVGTGYKGDGILGGIEHLKSELAMEQRHYAQEREDYAALSAEFRRQIKEAEARVREAEGLLRLWAGSLKPHKVPIQVAAFLAARGVTPTSGQSS